MDFTFDYQLDRHCSKTAWMTVVMMTGFDYQLDRHCSKTRGKDPKERNSLITS